MVGFDSSVDDQGTATPPMLLLDSGFNPVDIGRWIGSGERDPQKMIDSATAEVGIVTKDDQGKSIDRGIPSERSAKPSQPPLPVHGPGGTLHDQDARQNDPG